MTDYQLGLAIGGFIGWVLAFIVLAVIWGLCNMVHIREDEIIRIDGWSKSRGANAVGRRGTEDI